MPASTDSPAPAPHDEPSEDDVPIPGIDPATTADNPDLGEDDPQVPGP